MVTVIPILIGALGTIPKQLVRGLEELEIEWRAETIETTALLRRTTILRRVLDFEEICCHSNEKPSVGMKSSQSPGDLRRLVVTQTPVRNHQLTLMWKALKKRMQQISTE